MRPPDGPRPVGEVEQPGYRLSTFRAVGVGVDSVERWLGRTRHKTLRSNVEAHVDIPS